MAITHISLVNQKFAYAKATFSLLIADKNGLRHLQQQSLIDATVFHLICAYRFYLRELGENYRVKNLAEINDIQQLNRALSAIDKTPSEAAELATLAESQSWLAQLLDYFQSLQHSPVPMKEAKAFVSNTLIPAVNVTDVPIESSPVLSIDDLSAAFDNFYELIQRQRDTSAEY